MLNYAACLVVLSVLFVVLERLVPWRRDQKVLREGIVSDLLFLTINGHWLGPLLSMPWAYTWVRDHFDSVLGAVSLGGERTLATVFYLEAIALWPIWAQVALIFFVKDFLEWCVHNLLHRVPFLWQFHKVHHSIHDMDWIGVMRFHWMEKLIYDSFKYLLLVPLGIAPDVMLWLAIFSTFWGFYNHANIRIGMGPLRYFFNSPQMHIWHHAAKDPAPFLCNFGINLSLWDWIFGTVYWPEDREAPNAVGFDGDESFPRNFVEQELWPIRVRTLRPGNTNRRSRPLLRALGISVIVIAVIVLTYAI